MNVYIITIGDEILIGQIVDSNSAWMGQQLNLQGAEIRRIVSIGDEKADMLDALAEAQTHADVVLITGGLGPTKDDITKVALAEFFGVEMTFSQPTFDRLQRMFEKWGRSLTEGLRQQCYMPANATLLPNKMGTAPGMWFQENNTVFVSMPGVPYEMKYLMEQEVLPRLRQTFKGQPIAHRTLLTVGAGESTIAERLEHFEEELPPHIKLAYLPNLGQVRLRLTSRGNTSQEALEAELEQWISKLGALLPDLIFGVEKELLEAKIGDLLVDRNLTLATAESCTGGYIAHRITRIPGSSRYFTGSVIAYDNAVKQHILGVKTETLEAYGAVSEQTVHEMVAGTLKALNTDLAVATSGIAGPGGGTPEKPVGTIWMAVGNKDKIVTFKLQAGKDREKNIQFATVHALNLLRKFVLGVI